MFARAGIAGNDLSMAYERARVALDDPPSSPVHYKVMLLPDSTPAATIKLVYRHEVHCTYLLYLLPFSLFWRRPWPCIKLHLQYITTQTVGGALMSPLVKWVPSSKLPKKTCWVLYNCRWVGGDHMESVTRVVQITPVLFFCQQRAASCIFFFSSF